MRKGFKENFERNSHAEGISTICHPSVLPTSMQFSPLRQSHHCVLNPQGSSNTISCRPPDILPTIHQHHVLPTAYITYCAPSCIAHHHVSRSTRHASPTLGRSNILILARTLPVSRFRGLCCASSSGAPTLLVRFTLDLLTTPLLGGGRFGL